jgi:hypothetical protein
MASCNNSNFNFFKFINSSKRLFRSDRVCRISETNSPKIWLVSLCKDVPGDQKGLFKLAVQLRKFYILVIYNTAIGYVLLVYLTNI